ncbi:UNVERIFIED_CONTAM: hypothetical protein GTU68_025098 [Idotea baltica]|nr:hypothetical protein [Idotea baltica]
MVFATSAIVRFCTS